ncbi:MAG: spermidine synthase [Pseudomonadales bacterium]|nr:spermidine synthase [Pseudomonadales bacterium]
MMNGVVNPTLTGTVRQPSRLLFYGVVMVSGFAGLGYQMLWTKMLAVALGHEILAVLAVVAAFFVGLSLGAFVFSERLRRSTNPAAWYIAMELVIALWALLMMAILPDFNSWIAHWIGAEPSHWRHWSIAFFSSLLLLLPATLAMGATLPAMERLCVARYHARESVAVLYANNTAGAVLGTLLTTFLLIPWLGHSHTVILLAIANVFCATTTLLWYRQSVSPAEAPRSEHQYRLTHRHLLLVLFLTGFLGIGYEILMVRLLSQVLENTVYTFASVLAVYLLGVTIGAAVYHHRQGALKPGDDHWNIWLTRLLLCIGLSMLTGIAALYASERIYPAITQTGNAILGELVVAASVFLLPTFFMGALFSHLVQRAAIRTGLGIALGVNTLGAALAPFCVGVLLLPALGAKPVLGLLLSAYLLCLPSARNALKYIPVIIMAAALLWWAPPLRFISIAADSKVLQYRDGVMAAVAVVEDSNGHRHLKVNNHFTMGGTATRFSDHRQSHLPLLLHGAPRSALYLGLGTGISFEAARFYPGLETTGVDLIPETLDMMPWFGVNPEAMNWEPKPRLLAADARRFVLADQQQYDVIIGEIFHPSRDGAGSLYTLEQFAAIRERLTSEGIFAQWLPLFQLDLETLQTIIRTFMQVYPDAQLHLGHFSLQQPILCLVGAKRNLRFDANWLVNRVFDPTLQQELVRERLNSDLALFGGYLAGAETLHAYVGDGPINSDDHPVVTYSAPHFVYSDPAPPAHRLQQLLDQLQPTAQSLLHTTSDNREFSEQLQHYWQARNLFLQAGIDVKPNDTISNLVTQTREPLLKALSISPQFEPAYRALMGSAQAMYEVDRYQSYQLLSDLVQTAPERKEAAQLRYRLFGN